MVGKYLFHQLLKPERNRVQTCSEEVCNFRLNQPETFAGNNRNLSLNAAFRQIPAEMCGCVRAVCGFKLCVHPSK
jgi:hypothetical protein